MEITNLSAQKSSKITIILESECNVEIQKDYDELVLRLHGNVTSAHFHFGPGPGTNEEEELRKDSSYNFITM